MPKKTAVASIFVAGVLALAVPSAFAGTRYTSPSGSGSTCSSAGPCSIQTAFSGSSDGDEIVVGSGDYGSASSPIGDQLNADWKRLDVHGVAGQSLPRIYSNASDHAIFLSAYDSTAANLDIVWSGGLGSALVGAFSSVDHVRVDSSGGGIMVQTGPTSLTMTDVSAYATGEGEYGVGILPYPASTFTGILRNVTAVTTGQNSAGAWLQGGTTGGPTATTIDATNSIFRGPAGDILAGTTAANAGLTVNADHSNYETITKYGAGPNAVTDPAQNANQTAAPVFADLANGDVHQAVSSPTVDHGVTDGANGSSDIDGDARAVGASTDIGADEYLPPAPPPPPSDGGDQSNPNSLSSAGDPGPAGDSQQTGGQIPSSGAGEGTTSVVPAGVCVVPKLAGKTLKAAKAALAKAHCKLGKVARKASPRKAGRVLKQAVKPGKRIRAGAKVAVVLGRR